MLSSSFLVRIYVGVFDIDLITNFEVKIKSNPTKKAHSKE
jgi:hypothetical protein